MISVKEDGIQRQLLSLGSIFFWFCAVLTALIASHALWRGSTAASGTFCIFLGCSRKEATEGHEVGALTKVTSAQGWPFFSLWTRSDTSNLTATFLSYWVVNHPVCKVISLMLSCSFHWRKLRPGLIFTSILPLASSWGVKLSSLILTEQMETSPNSA